METYTKLSDTEAKITTTTTKEMVVSLDQLNEELKAFDDNEIKVQDSIQKYNNEQKIKRDAIVAKIAELEKIGIKTAVLSAQPINSIPL